MLLSLDFNSFSPWFWVIIFVVTILLELMTVDLMCIWFSVGALFALILEAFNAPFWAEVIVFLVVSLALIFTVGKYTRKLLKGKESTNVDALIGQDIIILKDTSFRELGEGRINGIIWSTIALNDEEIKAGEYAVIRKISGNKLFIESKEKGTN